MPAARTARESVPYYAVLGQLGAVFGYGLFAVGFALLLGGGALRRNGRARSYTMHLRKVSNYRIMWGEWYARRDSNSRPSGSKPDALSS